VSNEEPHPTPEQARGQLMISRLASVGSAADRQTYALGTAVLGVTVGGYFSVQALVSGAYGVLLACALVAVCAAEAVWVERTARTVPRGARLLSRLGFGASIGLALVMALPWLNLQARSGAITWPEVLTSALLVAAPSLVAAAVITQRRP